MGIKTNISLGFLLITLISTAFYVTLNEDVKIRLDDDKTTLYVKEDSRFKVAGREFNSIFDGSSKMNRRTSLINRSIIINEKDNTTTMTRRTPYIRGPVIVDTYFFDGNEEDVEQVPVYHKVEIFNGSGYFYRYEVKDLVYDGQKQKLSENTTYYSFGRKTSVEWQEDFRWAHIGWPGKVNSLAVQYDIQTDYEVFQVRLFDPPEINWSYIYPNKTIEVDDCFFENKSYQFPIYRNETDELCCSIVNETCHSCGVINFTCVTDQCYDWTHKVVDHYVTKWHLVEKCVKVEEQVPDTEKDPICIRIEKKKLEKPKIKCNKKGIEVTDDILVEWNFPKGQGWSCKKCKCDFYTTDWLKERGLCKETKLKDV